MQGRKTIITDDIREQILKRYIYGEHLSDMASELGVSLKTLSYHLSSRYGTLLRYRRESVVLYMQHPDHNIKDCAEHFHLHSASVFKILREHFQREKGTYEMDYYRGIPLDELQSLHAPFEQDVIKYLGGAPNSPRRKKHSIFEGLTKEERIAKAREINMRVKRNVAQTRLRKRREEELRHEHHSHRRIV